MYRYLLFFTLLLTETLFPSWSGSVYDRDTEAPLPFSIITHVKSDTWMVSDQFGSFTLPGAFSAGDTIRIQRYGYITQSLPLPAESYLIVFLKPDPIIIDPVITTGISTENKRQASYTYKSLSKISSADHRSFFTHFPGVTVRTYGGPGSIGLISIDGGSATHTSILLNGFNLGNNQTGITDLSQIPRVFLSKAQLQTSVGSIAGEETITINSQEADEILFERGSYGHESWSAAKKIQYKQFQIRTSIGQQKDKGNFSAQWRENTVVRTNNDFNQQYLSLQINMLLDKKEVVQFFGFVSEQKRGNPGQIWSPSEARRFDRISLIGISKHRLHAKGFNKYQFMLKTSDDNYKDPSRSYSAAHHLMTGSFNFLSRHAFNHYITLDNDIRIARDTLQSTAAGKHGLTWLDIGPGITVKTNNGFSLNLSLHGQWLSTDKGTLSNTVSIGYVSHNLSCGFSSSNINRVPTFNERYWSPGGNPDLKPEMLSNQKVFITWQKEKHFHITIELYSKFARDLIHWVPVTTYWQPVNITKVLRQGIKGMLDWQLSNRLTGSFAVNRVKTQYLVPGDHYGKPMVYAPNLIYTHTLNLEITKNISVSLRNHFMSEIISFYSWPEDIILPEISLYDISVTKNWPFAGMPFSTGFAVQNLTDVSYEMSKGYPEMGRSFRITLNLQLKEKNNL